MELERLLDEFAAAGKKDSSGRFSWDLARAQQLLPRFQLGDPDGYVLRVMASAVLGGAESFTLKRTRHGLALEWDGRLLSQEDLAQVIPSAVGGEPRLTELGVAIGVMRQSCRQLKLRGSSHRLVVSAENITLEPLAEVAEQNCFELTLGRWRSVSSWFKAASLPEELILKRRCSWAPLQLELPSGPVLSGLDIDDARAVVKVGEPPLPCEAPVLLELPANEWGCGYLSIERGDPFTRVIQNGVSYRLPWVPQTPHGCIYWWTSTMPLDLSRSALAEGPLYHEWMNWAVEKLRTLQVLLILTFAEQPGADLPLFCRWILERHGDSAQLAALPVFSMMDGSRVSLQQLLQRLEEQGYLACSSDAWQQDNGLDTASVLLVEPEYEAAVHLVFPMVVRVDHLAWADRVRRLPEPEKYLVRVPASNFDGELGLRVDCIPEASWSDGEGVVVKEEAFPYVDFASPYPSDKPRLAEVYLCLWNLRQRSPAVVFHQLIFIWRLGLELGRSRRVDEPLLDQILELVGPEQTHGLLQNEAVETLLERVQLPRLQSLPVGLLEIEEGAWCWTPPGCHGPKGSLRLLRGAAEALCGLLAPLNTFTQRVYSPQVHQLLSPGGDTIDLLGRMLTEDCSARRVLEQLGCAPNLQLLEQAPRDPPEEAAQRLQLVVDEALRHDVWLSSEGLLSALLRVECAARYLLKRSGVKSEAAARVAGRLAHAEFFEGVEPVDDPTWQQRYALYLLGKRHLVSALVACARGWELWPDPNIKLTEARCLIVAGQATRAVILLRQHSEQLEHQVCFWVNLAEAIWVGCEFANAPGSPGQEIVRKGRAEARLMLARAFQLGADARVHALDALFQLGHDPQRALSSCEQALGFDHYPASVWETRAAILEKMGNDEEARECLQRFVDEADPANLYEYRLEERLEVARKRLLNWAETLNEN